MGAADLKAKAKDAFRRKNYDLAVEMYIEALRFEPNDAEGVDGFFQAAKKARETKGKAVFGGMFSKVSIGSSRDPVKRIASALRGLAKSPQNKGLLLLLGQAAGEAGADEMATAAYQQATEVDPADADAWKRRGEFEGRRGRIREALEALSEAVRLSPRDQEAIKLRKNLAAEGALKTGYESAKSSRELIKDQSVAAEIEAESRLQLTPEHAAVEIEKVKQEIATTPANARLHVKLADLYLQRKDEQAAIAAFDEALRLDPRNFDLSVRVGDLRLRRVEAAARAASDAAKGNPGDEDLQAAHQAALRTLLEGRLKEYQRRVAEHPLDLAEKFRLGRTLLAAGRIDEAAAEFQATVRDPNRRIDSLLELARCFEKKKQLNLAVKKIEEAMGEFQSISSPRSKDVHYAYADLLERTGRKAEAREVFEKIYEVDITFRDVSQRLDALADVEAS
jgi:tetratricopeptide (TPR) repeat protein